MKKVILTLKQEKAFFETSKTIDSDLITEIAGTLINNVKRQKDLISKYKINMNGFSFNRKFEIEVTINDQKSTLNEIFGQQTVKFQTTLTEKSFKTFAGLVYELIEGMLIGEKESIVDFSEVLGNIPPNLN